YTRYCSKHEVDWYEVSRRLHGMLSLVDSADVLDENAPNTRLGYIYQHAAAVIVVQRHITRLATTVDQRLNTVDRWLTDGPTVVNGDLPPLTGGLAAVVNGSPPPLTVVDRRSLRLLPPLTDGAAVYEVVSTRNDPEAHVALWDWWI
ncbi:hypothetical protein Tco_0807904, partial [Tanacetum coccineum]